MSTTDDKMIRFFHKHVVPIHFTLQNGNKTVDRVVTAFVLSVFERWFLITAGHCLQQIDEAMNNGFTLTDCCLIDSFGEGVLHKGTIPFLSTYKDNHVVISDENGSDYGVIILTEFYKQALLKNNVVALNEEVWDKRPPRVILYKMLGLPEELVFADLDTIGIGSLFLNVEHISEKPDGFPETDIAMFYGKVNLKDKVESIVGMSGGPIFSFYSDDEGRLWYFLTALQSTWLENSHYIKACPTWVLGELIRGYLLRIMDEHP